MLQAKEGESICRDCGQAFEPMFPPKDDEADVICLFCAANRDAPEWYGEEGEEEQQP
jgi:hypothetical protein